MQDKTKRVGVCFVAAVLFVALGCGGNPSTPTPTPTPTVAQDGRIIDLFLATEIVRPDGNGNSLAAGPWIEQARLRVEEELVLSAQVRCDDGEVYTAGRFDAPCFTGNDAVAWRSSATTVATVRRGRSEFYAHEAAGVVQSVGLGQATVTVTFKGHSASLALDVVSGAGVTDRATTDRPDDISGAQIHFVYAVPVDAEDDAYDRAGDIAWIADRMQEWLRVEAGMAWRFDTYNGRLDVSFLPIQWQGQRDLGTILQDFQDALEAREGRPLNPQKKYAVFFDYDDAQGVFPVSGVASGNLALTHVSGPYHEHLAGIAIHEIIHTFGAVASCAPNVTGRGHVDDSPVDIMATGGIIGNVLDWGKDDYFRHENAGCLDIADTPYWERSTGDAGFRATSDARAGHSRWSIPLRCGGFVR